MAFNLPDLNRMAMDRVRKHNLYEACDRWYESAKSVYWGEDSVATILHSAHMPERIPEGYYGAQIGTWVSQGDCGMMKIEVGAGPHEDRYRDMNREELSDLPGPFKAFVFEGNGSAVNSDGSIKITGRIGRCWRESMLAWPRSRGHMIPLEIGSCGAGTIWYHLITSGSCARWPYGCKEITVLALWQRLYWELKGAVSLPYESRREQPERMQKQLAF